MEEASKCAGANTCVEVKWGHLGLRLGRLRGGASQVGKANPLFLLLTFCAKLGLQEIMADPHFAQHTLVIISSGDFLKLSQVLKWSVEGSARGGQILGDV